jgi:hypothetical protein
MSNYKTFTLGPGFLATDDDAVSLNLAVPSGTVALTAGAGTGNPFAQFLTFESNGDISGSTFTITGTDDFDLVISEELVGPADTTAISSLRLYKTVTGISSSAADTNTLKVGWIYSGTTVAYPVNFRQSPFNISASTQLLSGTGTASIQYTFDDPAEKGLARNAFLGTAHWRTLPDISGVAGDADATIIGPVTALRGVIDSGSDGSWKFVFIQGQNS